MMTSSDARISDLIGSIYDCVLDPKAWQNVLEQIRAEFGFANGLLAVNALDGSADFFALTRLLVDDLRTATESYGADIIAIWGGSKIRHYPLGEPIVLSRLQPREVILANRYYQDWGRAHGIYDGMTIRVTDDPVRYGNVTFGQSDAVGEISDDQIDGMRLLAPHLRRAVTISNVLENRTMEAATFAQTLDALQAAVVLVDEGCRIVHLNAAAQAMLSSGETIQAVNGSVTVAAGMSRQALVAAVRQAAIDETKLGGRGIGIPVKRSSGDPAVIHVLPLQRGTIRVGLHQRAVAALFVTPAHTPPQWPRDALVMLYDLTPAEVRVCEMICEGVQPGDIAATLGVSVNTVRSHLARAFDKTDTKRQVDLVRLLTSLTFTV